MDTENLKHMGSSSAIRQNSCAGGLAGLSSAEFAERFIPRRGAGMSIRAVDFLKGHTHSEAIEAAIAEAVKFTTTHSIVSVILDSREWLIDRAILLPSDIELVIDGVKLKLADGIHDNIIRSAGIKPNHEDPFGVCLSAEMTENIRITGCNGAVIEGADKPYIAANPKTGVVEPWLGDFFGWRTVGIQLSRVKKYEVSGFTMRKTHCWAISQELCSYGYLHDIVFDTDVKNGDGIDFRNGCSFCLVDNISGITSDDTVACTALNGTYITPESRYVYPMQPMGSQFEGEEADIHDIIIRNIRTGGKHHGVICLATSPKVYNIVIENVTEESPSRREATVKIYTGYGSGYIKGNLRNISVSNVVSSGSHYAVMIKAAVKNVRIVGAKQLNPEAETHLLEGESENLNIEN